MPGMPDSGSLSDAKAPSLLPNCCSRAKSRGASRCTRSPDACTSMSTASCCCRHGALRFNLHVQRGVHHETCNRCLLTMQGVQRPWTCMCSDNGTPDGYGLMIQLIRVPHLPCLCWCCCHLPDRQCAAADQRHGIVVAHHRPYALLACGVTSSRPRPPCPSVFWLKCEASVGNIGFPRLWSLPLRIDIINAASTYYIHSSS